MLSQIIAKKNINKQLLAKLSISDRSLVNKIKPGEPYSKVYTYGYQAEIIPWSDMWKITYKYSYTNAIFAVRKWEQQGHRSEKNVLDYGNLIILDVDNEEGKPPSYTIAEIQEKLRGVTALIVTTMKHSEEYNRFRLILLLDERIPHHINNKQYILLMHGAIKMVGLDPEKFDTSKFANSSQMAPNLMHLYNTPQWSHFQAQTSFYIEGETIPVAELMVYVKGVEELEKKHIRSNLFTPPSSNSANNIYLPRDLPILHKGKYIGNFQNLAQDTRCDCPHGTKHSDKHGYDYAFITQLSGGDVGIHCGGNGCVGLSYLPEKEVA